MTTPKLSLLTLLKVLCDKSFRPTGAFAFATAPTTSVQNFGEKVKKGRQKNSCRIAESAEVACGGSAGDCKSPLLGAKACG